MRKAGFGLVAAWLIASGSAAAADAAVIKTGAFGGNDSFFDTAATGLGPGSYRFSLALSTPVENLLGTAQKLTITNFFCDFDDGGGEISCGGDDVPTLPLFEGVTPLLYQAALTVNPPFSQPPTTPPYMRFEEFDTCCTFEFGFDTLDPGTYVLSYEAVPEPATWALMIGGLGLAGAALRRGRTPRKHAA